MCLNNGDYGEYYDNGPKERYGSIKKHKILVEQEDGSTTEMKPKDSLWYILYMRTNISSNRQKKLFRQRFRLT